MYKITPAWIDAQIEKELDRECCASAVYDLAALITVRNYLHGMQHDGTMAPMRDNNVINIGDYRDNRQSGMLPADKTHSREKESVDKYQMGNADNKMLEELTVDAATEWVEAMKNTDPDHPTGAKWTMEQTKPIAAKHGFTTPEKQVEFWASMNMMYSDYCEVAKKHGVSTLDYYADMTKAWMNDKDAVENKTAAYIEYCTK